MAKIQIFDIGTSKHLEFQIFKKVYDGKTLIDKKPVSPEYLRREDLERYAKEVGIKLNQCAICNKLT